MTEEATEMVLEDAVEIAAPREAVFEWLVDRERMGRWCEAIGTPASYAECLPADRAEVRAGYRSEIATETRAGLMGRKTVEATGTFEVTAYDPPARYATHSEHPDNVTDDAYTLEEAGGGTRLGQERRIRYRGMAAAGIKLAAGANHPGVEQFDTFAREDFRRSLEALKGLIEGEG